MADAGSRTEQVLAKLTRSESPLRAELEQLAVDYLLAQRLRDAVSLPRLRAVVMQALTEENIERIVARHVRPGWLRYGQAVAGAEGDLGGLLGRGAHPNIHAIARKLRPPRAPWAQGAVDPGLVRKLLAPVWTQVLLSFATRLPIPGIGGAAGGAGGKREASGVTGFLARSVQTQAEKLVDRGRSVMGGLGLEVEKRLSDAARGFSDTAAQIFREALRERLASREGRELLAQITSSVVEQVLRAGLAELHRDVEALPVDDILAVAPQVVAHAARSAHVDRIVTQELDAYLAAEGDRTLRELLQELGVLDSARALLLGQATALSAGFVAAPAFADWLARLLAD